MQGDPHPCKSNAPPDESPVDESPDKKKVRFSSEPGDGGACAITVEEQVEDCWSDEHGQGELFEGLHNKVEPDVDTAATEAAPDRPLASGVVRDISRGDGAAGGNVTLSGSSKCAL